MEANAALMEPLKRQRMMQPAIRSGSARYGDGVGGACGASRGSAAVSAGGAAGTHSAGSASAAKG